MLYIYVIRRRKVRARNENTAAIAVYILYTIIIIYIIAATTDHRISLSNEVI